MSVSVTELASFPPDSPARVVDSVQSQHLGFVQAESSGSERTAMDIQIASDVTKGDSYRTVPRSSLADHVEAFLARRIVSGDLPQGSPLPSQDDLVRQFGVSRAVVRQAINSLAQRGLLDVRHGRSTFVTPKTNWDILDPFIVRVFAEHESIRQVLQDLFSVRLLLEPEEAAIVAVGRSAAQLRAIGETIERMELSSTCSSREDVIRADRDFHWQLAMASGNQVLTSIMRDIQALLWTQFGLAASLFAPQDRVLPQHKAVFRALEIGDGNAARETMRLHLLDAQDRFLRALPQ